MPLDLSNINLANNDKLGENWVIKILPQIESRTLLVTMNLNQPISGGATFKGNMDARKVPLAVMLCPSDAYNSKPFMGSASSLTSNMGDNWARGNYAANASLGYMTPTNGSSGGTSTTQTLGGVGISPSQPANGFWGDRYRRGVMGANAAIALKDVRDGTSKTLLLGEIRAGLISQDTRGVWAMSGAARALCGPTAILLTTMGRTTTSPTATTSERAAKSKTRWAAATAAVALAKNGHFRWECRAGTAMGPTFSKPPAACTAEV